MSRIRTFIGVDLGKAVRGRIVALQENLARSGVEVKWVEPENLHVTLLFLGEVDERDVMSVCRAVAAGVQSHVPFTIGIEKTGCFPTPRRPRVVWVGIEEGAAQLRAIHNSLEGPLLALGCYRREERKYTPHITLGRVKGDTGVDALGVALGRHASWKGGAIEVREVQVMSSQLTSRGPAYAVLSRCKLGG